MGKGIARADLWSPCRWDLWDEVVLPLGKLSALFVVVVVAAVFLTANFLVFAVIFAVVLVFVVIFAIVLVLSVVLSAVVFAALAFSRTIVVPGVIVPWVFSVSPGIVIIL